MEQVENLASLLECGAFAGCGVENFFAEAEIFWRGFDVFVGGDVFERAFERHFQRRFELYPLPFALAADVRRGYTPVQNKFLKRWEKTSVSGDNGWWK
jgi:hypothetical protein